MDHVHKLDDQLPLSSDNFAGLLSNADQFLGTLPE